MARIVAAWGVKGGIKLKPYAADPQALFSSKRWFLRPAPAGVGPDRPVATQLPGLLRVRSAREQGDTVVAEIDGIADRDAALALVGARVFVSRQSFPTPEPDEFYWVDLIGLEVVSREQVNLGRVIGLIETGPTCVLRVQADVEPARERLIPFVSAYVDAVELAEGRIRVDWGVDD